mgnify:CR=1 FL=1
MFVPDLTEVAHTGEVPFDFCVDAALRAIPQGEEVVLVGHSDSGLLLPFVAQRMHSSPKQFIFVDAGVPPITGGVRPAEEAFRTFLDSMVDADGLLPKWSQWWSEEAMQSMLPDAARRKQVEAEIPRLPLRYYDHSPTVPREGSRTLAAFLQLSDGYRSDAEQARTLGWPLLKLPGQHLHIVTDPDAVTDALPTLMGAVSDHP